MGKMIQIEAIKPVDAYLAEPTGDPKGAIIVVHEVWGLNDHTKSIADRYANEGYIALAPELLDDLDFSSIDVEQMQKDMFNTVETRNKVQPELRKLTSPMHEPEFAEKTNNRVAALFNYLYDLPSAKQKVAITGFCFGGSTSFSLAVNEPRLKIALPFYGHADQTVEELRKITCPIRSFFGEQDTNLMAMLPGLEERMHEAGVDFTATVYKNCGHAFFNDTNPYAYNEDAAKLSWESAKEELAKAFAD